MSNTTINTQQKDKLLIDNKKTYSSNRFFVKINTKSYLPSFLVKDVVFPWPIIKDVERYFNILKFNKKEHNSADFKIIFYKPVNHNLFYNLKDLMLNQNQFDIEVFYLDEKGEILSPKILLKNSKVLTILLPSLSCETNTNTSVNLEVGFNCEEVIID